MRAQSSRAFFRCIFSMVMIAASGSECSALFFFSPSSCLLPRCLAALSHRSGEKSSHAWMRHVLHVARRSGTTSESFLGQLRPRNRCSSPHLDKLLLSRSQTAPRSTRVGQPYWAEAEPAGRAEQRCTHAVGAVLTPVHQSSGQTDSFHYQTLIIRHRTHSDGASFITGGMTRRGAVL